MTPAPARHRASAGMTIIEVAVSLVITAVMLVAALNTIGASRDRQVRAERRAVGSALADDLLSQVCEYAYEDPDALVRLFGREVSELLAGKSGLNDIDDFNNWEEDPPLDQSGSPLAGLSGWTRTVSVAWVNSSAPTTTSVTETGAKRITVIARFKKVPMATRVAIRTSGPAPTSPSDGSGTGAAAAATSPSK